MTTTPRPLSGLVMKIDLSLANDRSTVSVRILWRDNISYRLLIKESLVIRAHEPVLNRTTHSVPLLVFPEGLERDLVPDPNG